MCASREATYRYEFVVKSERCVVVDGLNVIFNAKKYHRLGNMVLKF